MSLNLRSKALAAAVAVAVSGAALANTTLDGTTTGDLFLNIVNTTNNTSFLYDTGISQASFNGNGSYTFNLASDPNYQAFIAASGSLDYSVVSATNTGPTNPLRDTDFVTSVVVPPSGSVTHSSEGQAQSIISTFLSAANSVNSSTANSALLSPTNFWGQSTVEGGVSGNLLNVTLAPYADSTTPGTALSFYGFNGNALTTFASTWDLNGSQLTYGSGTVSSVPLPTSVVLLLSGLGLMGVVSRRRKPISV